MQRGVRLLTLSDKGGSLMIDMPGWYAGHAPHGIHTGQDMKTSGRALNRSKARAEGLLEPGQIKRIRKRLGLTQEAAGELIGGGPRAFQKYGTGELLPSRAIGSALRLLDHDPAALDVLRPVRRASGPSASAVPAS